MKRKYGLLITCLVFLFLFTMANFNIINTYYDQYLNFSKDYTSFEKEFIKENLLARESAEEYEKMIMPAEEDLDNSSEDKKIESYVKLNSLSALLMDGDNNRVLYEKNGFERRSMASTTKIMTCIVALENGKPDEIVTVSSYAARMPDVQLNIRTDEEYYLGDLMYSLMLESHNDVAVAIAEHIGGSVEGFATMMNDKARSLGCMNTNFVTANGLDAENHYSTAEDLAVIASYAINNEEFIKITNASSHTFSEIKSGRTFTVTNKNKFLYMMDGAIGVKTGFTNQAGYCFVGAIKRPDRTLISVVLGCGWPPSRSLKWTDTKRLMEYGINNYERKQIFQEVDLEPIYVQDGQIPYEHISLTGDMEILLHKNEEIHVYYDLPKVLIAPVEEGEIVGYANYYIDDQPYEEIPIYSEYAVEKIDYFFCLKNIFRIWSLQY